MQVLKNKKIKPMMQQKKSLPTIQSEDYLMRKISNIGEVAPRWKNVFSAWEYDEEHSFVFMLKWWRRIVSDVQWKICYFLPSRLKLSTLMSFLRNKNGCICRFIIIAVSNIYNFFYFSEDVTCWGDFQMKFNVSYNTKTYIIA